MARARFLNRDLLAVAMCRCDLQLEQRSMNGTAVIAGDNPWLGKGWRVDCGAMQDH